MQNVFASNCVKAFRNVIKLRQDRYHSFMTLLKALSQFDGKICLHGFLQRVIIRLR
jgi:hypothetical protein